jgi:hypothetical protein
MRIWVVLLLAFGLGTSLSFQDSLFARCRDTLRVLSLINDLESQAPQLRPPIGMNRKDLAELLIFMQDNPEFSDAEVIVLYGSRTNHSEGPKPLSISDLDILVHWNSETYSPNDLLRKSVDASDELRPWKSLLGFTVEIQIPGVMSFDRFLEDRIPLHDAIDEMRALDEEVRTENYGAHYHRKAFKELMNRHKTHVNPGAIFVLRNPRKARQWEVVLRNLGFSQIVHLYSDRR